MKSNIAKISFIVIVLFGAWSIQSCTEERGNSYTNKTKVNAEGVKFITTAHEAGLVEIKAAEIAKKNSTNPQVIGFADMMIKDHQEMAKNVDTLASEKFVTVVNKVSYDHQGVLDSLAKKTGAEFDKAYIEMMVADHEGAVELFDDNEKSNYTSVREVAEKWDPILAGHLKQAKAIQASLK